MCAGGSAEATDDEALAAADAVSGSSSSISRPILYGSLGHDVRGGGGAVANANEQRTKISARFHAVVGQKKMTEIMPSDRRTEAAQFTEQCVPLLAT